jgi:Arc/MetJ family transcription regulator
LHGARGMCTFNAIYTHSCGVVVPMRTNIVIDEKLIAEAMKLSGAPTKRQAVEESLRLMVRLKRQERIRRARGKLQWTGDLAAMRRD